MTKHKSHPVINAIIIPVIIIETIINIIPILYPTAYLKV